jgi:hypothetical protein
MGPALWVKPRHLPACRLSCHMPADRTCVPCSSPECVVDAIGVLDLYRDRLAVSLTPRPVALVPRSIILCPRCMSRMTNTVIRWISCAKCVSQGGFGPRFLTRTAQILQHTRGFERNVILRLALNDIAALSTRDPLSSAMADAIVTCATVQPRPDRSTKQGKCFRCSMSTSRPARRLWP